MARLARGVVLGMLHRVTQGALPEAFGEEVRACLGTPETWPQEGQTGMIVYAVPVIPAAEIVAARSLHGKTWINEAHRNESTELSAARRRSD